ncbi:glucosylceramidase [Anaerosporobacter mobilis DSM 15930]|uniref:Glucosylceramidase n=1 Tax=Anaerosporobacter mobilis DSM 15930 TaxID=1120996 RepID=A0A1M7JDD0_9FIRM|nr:glycoside hydrolase family 30 beta sandwich domain-containing protein [Anaerosporobacter mobilis]SHM50974.1 glucosylceramidase [Anaerosporobacter mobilis DSM 15930]
MKITSITTNYSEDRFLETTSVVQGMEVGCMNVVNLYPDVMYQKIRGFGGAFTESAGYTLSKLSKEKQKEIAEAYFGESGIGYTIGRTHINSCDFSLGNYAYVEDPEDKNLETFTRERDQLYIVPFIRLAQQVTTQKIEFLASPWSPPAFMKTNGEMNHGGKLKEEYRKLWAEYICRYIKDCLEDDIPVTMITVQNEPEATQEWDSCRYSAEEEMEFVRDYLGPIMEEQGLGDVKIYIWDHNKEVMYERAQDILKDEKAAQYIAGVGFHWYTGDHFEAVSLVREQYPDKELLFTEGCVEYSRFMDSNDVYKAEMYAHDILGNLNAGMNGYIDWNLVLDEKGGPNHVNNLCAAPIMCDCNEGTYEKRLAYYYVGHFSKYIRGGARRIAVTKYTEQIEVTAFMNPEGEKVVVLLNKQDRDIPVVLREYGIGTELTVKGHSIVTLIIEEN